MDLSHHQSRIHDILDQLGSTTVLASSENLIIFDTAVVSRVIEVSGPSITTRMANAYDVETL